MKIKLNKIICWLIGHRGIHKDFLTKGICSEFKCNRCNYTREEIKWPHEDIEIN